MTGTRRAEWPINGRWNERDDLAVICVVEAPAVLARYCHDHAMPSHRWADRTVVARLPVAVAVVVGALVVGSLIGLNLPFGSKPVVVGRGSAAFIHARHLGTFDASRSDVTALIPGEVSWTDRNGNHEGGSLPSCLRARGHQAVTMAPVEAGYTQLRLPDGSSSMIVAWIRCL